MIFKIRRTSLQNHRKKGLYYNLLHRNLSHYPNVLAKRTPKTGYQYRARVKYVHAKPCYHSLLSGGEER